MSVTREVSQPEMSASKLPMPRKSWLMSATPETSQQSMGPYFAVAATTFESYSLTAVLREGLYVKVVQGRGGEGEGEGGGGGGGRGEGDSGGPVGGAGGVSGGAGGLLGGAGADGG